MTKRKKSKLSFPSLKPWLAALIAGIAIGISSQHIPQVRAYTHEAFPLESTLPGHPVSSFLIHRPGYSLAYDARNRNPAWVYEHLTADSVKGKADRSHAKFKEDDSLPQHLIAKLADFKDQGYDRGHMAPAADHRFSKEAMADTFYMSNMCQQCPQFNRGYWARLEKHVRDLTKDYQNIYVITPTIRVNFFKGR